MGKSTLTRLRKLEASQTNRPVLVWFNSEIAGDFERKCQDLVSSGRASAATEFQGVRWVTSTEAEAGQHPGLRP